MDRILDLLSTYATCIAARELPREVVHHVKRRVIDTLGCAIGCFHLEAPRIARAHALEVSSAPGSTILGTRHRSAPEHAAFANGVMARYLDFNDTSMSGNAGHPSDNIMAILAAAEYAGADIGRVIAGVVVAYEIQGRFGAACKDMRARGWDNAVYVGIASAAGAATVLGLDKAGIANAIALAAVPNAPMGQTRVGELSMWKGCTAPNAARNGVFAALLARRGMTGPMEAFEGPRGFKKLLGTSLELQRFGGDGVPFAVESDKFKAYPCDYEAQCCLTPALALHPLVKGRLNEIEKIDIETYDHAMLISADTPAKWSPTNRETADHSLPYVVAVGLARGTLWLEDFDEARIRDGEIHALMQKIAVRATEECNRAWPEAYPFRMTVTTTSGRTLVEEVRYAKGHPKNPMSDAEIETKFRRLAEPIIGEPAAAIALERLWQLEAFESTRDILELFALNAAR